MASRKSATAAIVESDAEVLSALPAMSKRVDLVGKVETLADLRAVIGQEITWSEIEPSFDVVAQAVFEGIPMVIGGFRFNDSKKFAKPSASNPDVLEPLRFVSMLVAPYDEENENLIGPWVIVNDGSTGICKSLLKYAGNVIGDDYDKVPLEELNAAAQQTPPIRAEKGLRKSEYPYTAENGVVSTATTWYIG